MNLTGRPPVQKPKRSGSTHTAAKRRNNRPTAEDKWHFERVAALGCMVGNGECRGRITIHHAGCGGGGRKDHRKVIGLCERHHLQDLGINGGKMSRREWEGRYATEEELLERVARLLS